MIRPVWRGAILIVAITGCGNAATNPSAAPPRSPSPATAAATSPAPSTGATVHDASPTAPDPAAVFGSWRVELTAPELVAAGAPPNDAEAGVFTWTFEQSRGRIEVTAPDGAQLTACEADLRIAADLLHLEYDDGPCGGEVDEIRWAVGLDGLHLTLLETNAPFEVNRAYLEAKPWQRVAQEATFPASCPSPHGGSCLGQLRAGTYVTRTFRPKLTYTVSDGWANLEDLPGNFLLLPPGATLEAVDPGASDYIGAYSAVAAPLSDCSSRPDPSVPETAAGYLEWLRANDSLVTSDAVPAEVGRLRGTSVDVALRPEAGDCSDPAIGLDRFTEIAVGLAPSSFSASVTPDVAVRLYVLDVAERTLLVLVSDAGTGGSDFSDWRAAADPVVAALEFEVPGSE